MHRLLRECYNYLLSLKGTEPFFIQLLLYRFHSLLKIAHFYLLSKSLHTLSDFCLFLCVTNLYFGQTNGFPSSRYLAKLHRDFSKNFPRSIQLYNWQEKPRSRESAAARAVSNQAFSLRQSLPEEMKRD